VSAARFPLSVGGFCLHSPLSLYKLSAIAAKTRREERREKEEIWETRGNNDVGVKMSE
jgi:hypothetical protein